MQDKVLPLSLRASRFALSHLGKVFPGTAANIFLKLYSTPPKRRFKPSHLQLKKSAVTSVLPFTKYAFDKDSIRLMVYKWGAASKKILLLHGWGSSPLDFKYMIENLVLQGYEVVAFDAPAHGFSEGKQTNLVQWLHVLEQFLNTSGPYHAIIGHSLGGFTAAFTLAIKDQHVKKLVMISSSVSAPSFFKDTFDMFKINQNVRQKVALAIKQKLLFDLDHLDLNHHINKIKADEVLYINDKSDMLVRHDEIQQFLAKYPSIQSFTVDGEGHFRIIKSPVVIDKIKDFIST